MKILQYALLKIYMIWCILVFSIFMVIYLPGIIFPFLFGEKRGGALGYAFLKLWSWTFSKLTGISYHIIKKESIKKDNAYIYISNHTSYLDLPGISLAIPTQFRPLAKKELKRIPIFRWITQCATIVIDRSSIQSRNVTVKKLKTTLDLNISILIFPEGTQNRSDKPLQRFYDGAFHIAIEAQRPIIPIAIINAGKLMPPNRIHIEPGTITITMGKPIETTGLKKTDFPKLKKDVYNAIYRMICDKPDNPPPQSK